MSESRSATPRMTLSTQVVLRALLQDPSRAMYGLELGRLAGLPSGTIHPILARLEGIGWIESAWETDVNPSEEGRPRRRYYRLTPDGAQLASEALSRVQAAPGSVTARLHPGLA